MQPATGSYTQSVVLDEQQIPLSRVLNLKVGETLMLNASPESLVQLRCGGVPLTRARMGRRGGKIAVRVEAPLSQEARKVVTARR